MKTAKVIPSGRSLAVRIPKSWLGDVSEVQLERVGDTIQIRPKRATAGEIAREFQDDPVFIERLPQSSTPPKDLFSECEN
ncbi:MAG: antitoxin [Puniceicoccales bacterium]